MLCAIEKVHDMGYIHRDIKPSNFVVGKGKLNDKIYIVDFGLCKLHLNNKGVAVEARKSADFRGTVTYASLNAHNKIVFISIIAGLITQR
jgi:tau tubulin kinase